MILLATRAGGWTGIIFDPQLGANSLEGDAHDAPGFRIEPAAIEEWSDGHGGLQ
jgi:hypothetical protein